MIESKQYNSYINIIKEKLSKKVYFPKQLLIILVKSIYI